MDAEIRFAAVGAARVGFCVHGQGDLDIVYAPGLASHLDLTLEQPRYRRYIESLQRFGRVIRFDRRGSGISDPPPADDSESWEMWTEDLAGVLASAGSRRVAIIAANDAGPAAILFAAQNPESMHGLVLFNTTARFLAGEDYPQGHPPEVGTHVAESLRATWGTESSAALLAPSLAADESFRRWYARFQRGACSPGAMAASMQRLFMLDVRSALSEVQCPTLVLHRKEYGVLPSSHGEAISRGIRDARLEILPGADAPIYTQNMHDIVDGIGRFLGTSAPSVQDGRQFRVIVFTDIVSSTERLVAVGDREWSEVLDAHDTIVRETIAHHQGQVIEITGDGMMATFGAPTRALRCVEDLRARLHALGLDLRAGLHAGPVVLRDDGRISGVSVHVAARLQALASRGETLVSEPLAALITGKEFTFSGWERHSLKGLPGQWCIGRLSPGMTR